MFLSLGSTPIANRLLPLSGVEHEDSYPLEVGLCEICALVQVMHDLPRDALFDDDYPYFSSFSDSLRVHSEAHAEELIAERGLGPDSLVVEVASNDGYLLRAFRNRGIPVLGIEPTAGPAAAARKEGIETIQEFFGTELANQLVAKGIQADVVIANNVMAHVPDLNDFVGGLAAIVKPDGIVSVENPNVWDLIEHSEFDTIYHEHYCYFSTLAVDNLMTRHGLTLFDVFRFEDLHGGTLRWRMGKGVAPGPRAVARLDAEREAGLDKFAFYADFAGTVNELQRELLELLHDLKGRGASIAAYGAAAKGATLLNSTGIDVSTIDFVADRNDHKQNMLMPGARIPILPPEQLLQQRPDYVLILAWNMRREIMAQQTEFRDGGGKFIIPVPKPHVV
jgi:SAM-dependent methyltransferase